MSIKRTNNDNMFRTVEQFVTSRGRYPSAVALHNICREFAEKMQALGVTKRGLWLWSNDDGKWLVSNGKPISDGYLFLTFVGCDDDTEYVTWYVSGEGVLHYCRQSFVLGHSQVCNLTRITTWDELDAVAVACDGYEAALFYDDIYESMNKMLEGAAYDHWMSACRDTNGRFKKSA